MFDKLKEKLIDNLHQAHNFLSIQLAALLGLLQTAYDFLPAIREYFPHSWQAYLAVAIIVARVWKQSKVNDVKP